MHVSTTTHFSRSARLSTLKSSFRDKDKPPKYKDLQTKFQDLPNDDSSSGTSNGEDEETLLDTDFDTRYGRSFRYGEYTQQFKKIICGFFLKMIFVSINFPSIW